MRTKPQTVAVNPARAAACQAGRDIRQKSIECLGTVQATERPDELQSNWPAQLKALLSRRVFECGPGLLCG